MAAAVVVDIFLRPVPSDADPDDVRLYDPTLPDGAPPAPTFQPAAMLIAT